MEEHNDLHTKIQVTATPRHEKNQSVQGASHVFSYHIVISNFSNVPVQLLRRHWFISDGVMGEREVEGEGVIGQMPLLKPGQKFEYESWCPIATEYGSMRGFFTFTNLHTKDVFHVDIPPFVLLPEFALN